VKGRWKVGRTGQKRERIGQDPRWRESVIERFSWSDRKVARRSRDRGCNGHRILRRVLTEGRHPGLLASVGRHGPAWKASLAASPSRSLRADAQQDDERSRHARRRRERRDEREEATGMSEARLNLAPWEENAHARVGKAVRQNARGKRGGTIRRSGPNGVNCLVPRYYRAEP